MVQSEASLSEEAMQLCHQVHEEHKVQDLGKFTAFQDGSVHVAFEDRALLYMEPEGVHCNVITPEGQKVHVAIANPLGVEQYVAEAVDFAAWAVCSPAQRTAVLRQASIIQKELDKCQRSALLCDWAQGHVVDVQTAAEVSQAEYVQYGAKSDCHEHGSSVPCFLATSDGQLDSQKRQQLIESFLANNNQLLNTL